MEPLAAVMLLGLANAIVMGVAEVGDIPRGVLRSVFIGAPSWSVLIWMAVKSWRQRRRFLLTHLLDELGPPGAQAPAAPIRLVGIVEPSGELFDAPGTDRKVVYARTLFRESDLGNRPSEVAREEIRGVPFRIRLDTGTIVNLPPAEVHLADRPERLRNVSPDILRSLGAALRGTLCRRESPFLQATLAPGDRVEVVGQLNAQVHVDGTAGPSRPTPLAHAMAPPGSGAIWVRHKKS
jgi:hypothetical protein